jgi:hypothetical protein
MPHWLKALYAAAALLLVAVVSVDPPLQEWLVWPALAVGLAAFVALLGPLLGPLVGPLFAPPARPGRHRRSHP